MTSSAGAVAGAADSANAGAPAHTAPTGASADASDARPPPPPDVPTGVVFDWPETVPGAPGACKPGHYVGEYSCRLYIVQMSGPGAFDLNGVIDMQLEQSTDGERLLVKDGRYESTTAAVIPASADIIGELNCSTGRFEAQLQNGSFSVALGLGVPFTDGTFSGPMSSDYDKSMSAMTNGVWDMDGELDGFPGYCMNGTWSAHWVP